MTMSGGFQFTDKTSEVLRTAMDKAKDNCNVHVAPVHIALALLEEGEGSSATPGLFVNVINKAGADPTLFTRSLNKRVVREPRQEPPPDELSFGSASAKVLKSAQTLMKEQNDSYIAQDHLILALLEDSTLKQIMKELEVSEKSVKDAVKSIRGGRKVESKNAEESFDALNKYAIDMTIVAAEGKYDPVIGRDNEIRRVIRILTRRTKNNPVLIGEPGVGKSAIAEGLAQRIVNRDVPASLLGKLFSLDLGALAAGASFKGQHEERVKSILNEIEKAQSEGQHIILFVDEMHLIMAGQGSQQGGMDVANLLKPVLARGKLRIVGATTLSEYHKYIEKDAAFERRFQQVLVAEPSVPETISILRGLKERYEIHHGVTILDGSLVQAAQLAHRYLTARKLPDSAIDLIDEAAAAVQVTRDSQPEHVDKLERKRLQLEVEAHALTKEKDDASKERLLLSRKEIATINDELQPLKAQWEATKKRGDEIKVLKGRIDKLKAKADEAERRYDVATAADIRHYGIPDLQEQVDKLERRKLQDAAYLESDIVNADSIAEIVARWTGIPVTRLKTSERTKLLTMERALSKEVVGQPEAVKAIANAIRLSRSGLGNESRPVASFLFCGPSGTGKTLLTKALAKFLFDSEDAICRIDGSEYSEKHSISRLIGSPPGYVGHEEGGTLTEWVRRKPYTIVLIDEIEKAAKEFTTLFLQVLDDGRLTDSQGRVVSFRNTVVICTSNLGAQFLEQVADDAPIPEAAKNMVMSAVRGHFVPDKIDSIVVFNKLGRSQVRSIVEVRLAEVQKRLYTNGKNIKLQLTELAKDMLGEMGYNPAYGARPLNRAIQNELLHPLSQFILNDQIRDGEVARISADRRQHRLIIKPNHEATFLNVDVNGGDEEVDVEETD